MPQQAKAVMPHGATGGPRRGYRWFYISIAVLMILFNIVAFAPSLIDPSRRFAPLPLTPLVTAHAIVSAGWLLLFLLQAVLVATERTALHRRLGIFGAVLTALFLVVGYFTVIDLARRGFDLSGDFGNPRPQPGEPIDPRGPVGLLSIFVVFGTLAGLGLAYRHRPEVHKRLMLLAMVGLVTTPLTHVIGHWSPRWPGLGVIFLPVLFLSLFASAIHDRVSQGRVHPVSLWGAILVFVLQSFFFSEIQPSSAWLEFATWLTR